MDFLEEEGYKRNKNIYTPPLLQLGPFYGVHWLADIVPEIIWIALLQNRFGLDHGSRLALKLSELLNQITEKRIWNAPVIYFANISVNQKKLFSDEIEKLKFAADYIAAFGYFTFLYPNFPLAFISGEVVNPDKLEFDKFKKLLSELSHRLSSPSTFMQATAIDFCFQANIMTVAHGTSLAEFPEIGFYPNTELSKRVASGIRSALNLHFANKDLYDLPSTWKSYFWNRGLELEKCY